MRTMVGPIFFPQNHTFFADCLFHAEIPRKRLDILSFQCYNFTIKNAETKQKKGFGDMEKKKRRKGFTLVELIVILVILAILAAILVPALTGYIDKARKSQVIAETRMITQAVQAEMSELYASDEYRTQLSAHTNTCTAASKSGDSVLEHEQKVTGLKNRYDEIVKLAEVPSITNDTGSFVAITDLNCKIRWIIYSDSKGFCGLYNGEEGTYQAFTSKEAPDYNTSFHTYLNTVICQDFSKETIWTTENIAGMLGLTDF